MSKSSVLNALWGKGTRFLRGGWRWHWNKLTGRIDRPPIFIVGCGHSGTTLLLAILATHSKIHGIAYESSIAWKDRGHFETECAKFDKEAVWNGKRRWIEKTPRHIHRIGELLQWRPDAKIILIMRDGRDVACSIKARTGSAEEGIRRWVDDNMAGKPYWGNPQVHMMKYEDLVADFETVMRKITDFLGEKYEPSLKDYAKVERRWTASVIEKPKDAFKDNHNQHRNWQINQPLFDGRGRWKDLSPAELEIVYAIGGGMLAEFGYAKPMEHGACSPTPPGAQTAHPDAQQLAHKGS